METRIASYQEPGIRLQLIKVENEKIGTYGELNITEQYQIRRNRKVLCNIKWEGPAKQKFSLIIQNELLQTNIFSKYEKKKQ